MIVKVQQSLGGEPGVLIYNKDRTLMWEFSERSHLMNYTAFRFLLGDRPKAYFNASIIHDCFTVDGEVPTQPW